MIQNFKIDYNNKIELDETVFFIPYRHTFDRVILFDYQLKYLSSIIDNPQIYILESASEGNITLSGDILQNFATFHKLTFTPHILYDLENTPFHKTKYLNMLIRAVLKYQPHKYKYVCILDYDTILMPKTFELAIQELEEWKIENWTPTMLVPHSAVIMLNSEQSSFVLSKGISALGEFKAVVNNQHPGGVQFAHFNVLTSVNGWNEGIYLGGEDIEIYRRIDRLYGTPERIPTVAYHLYHEKYNWQETKEYKEALPLIDNVLNMNKETIKNYSFNIMKGLNNE